MKKTARSRKHRSQAAFHPASTVTMTTRGSCRAPLHIPPTLSLTQQTPMTSSRSKWLVNTCQSRHCRLPQLICNMAAGTFSQVSYYHAGMAPLDTATGLTNMSHGNPTSSSKGSLFSRPVMDSTLKTHRIHNAWALEVPPYQFHWHLSPNKSTDDQATELEEVVERLYSEETDLIKRAGDTLGAGSRLSTTPVSFAEYDLQQRSIRWTIDERNDVLHLLKEVEDRRMLQTKVSTL